MNNTTAGPGPAVGIMGAGAIGLYVGGMLAKAGAHVVFAARGRTLESLSRGLSLSRYDGFKAALKPEHYAVGGVDGLAECDVVLFCTKSGDTEAAAIDLARVLKPDARSSACRTASAMWSCSSDWCRPIRSSQALSPSTWSAYPPMPCIARWKARF
jgi:NAD(P)-dependent dehydrogenase (short-subunit alcohol dehydrogenase family)